jgi:hypothetical protein
MPVLTALTRMLYGARANAIDLRVESIAPEQSLQGSKIC